MKFETFAIIVIVLAVFCIVFEFAGGADWLIERAEASTTAQTTVTVVIQEEVSSASVTASVPCNEVNCSEEVEEVGWFTRFKNWVAGLWVF